MRQEEDLYLAQQCDANIDVILEVMTTIWLTTVPT